MSELVIKILAGLGNPGDRYLDTRHNIGFMIVDSVQARLQCTGPQSRFSGVTYECRNVDSRLVLLKPMTYMNLSGRSVVQALNWYKANFDDLLVVYDDLDLPFGEVRLRSKGSAGGHNGLESIIASVASGEVPRLRIGIGPSGSRSGRSYVLSRFDPEQAAHLEALIDHAADAAICWWQDGLLEAMNRFNGINVLDGPE